MDGFREIYLIIQALQRNSSLIEQHNKEHIE